MKSTKTLCVLVSLLTAASIAVAGCEKTSEEKVTEIREEYQIKSLTGTITFIDEDFIAIRRNEGGSNFSFEHITIQDSSGKKYKLISPGPTNYQIGEEISVEYALKPRISYEEIVEIGKKSTAYVSAAQEGYFNIDGVIIDY